VGIFHYRKAHFFPKNPRVISIDAGGVKGKSGFFLCFLITKPERGNRRTDEQGISLGAKRKIICEANNDRRGMVHVEVPERHIY